MLALLMAGDNHTASSLFRRAEQLKRWKESETNRQDYSDRPKNNKVTFSSGCIFLAAAAAGDKDEIRLLLDRGADINTFNSDGITALHAVSTIILLQTTIFLVWNHDNSGIIHQKLIEAKGNISKMAASRLVFTLIVYFIFIVILSADRLRPLENDINVKINNRCNCILCILPFMTSRVS